MLFTWDTTDLCIVFRGWHISGTGTLIFSLLAIVLLTAGYEAVREISRRYEDHTRKLTEGRRGGDDVRGESKHLIHTTGHRADEPMHQCAVEDAWDASTAVCESSRLDGVFFQFT